MPQPLLSIGMIVKNEERCLEKCLKSLEPLRQAIPCELVIADTGSTDKTKKIAEKYADILFDFKWVNDFSAARNAVIDKCSGKWYLTVDADEYLNSSVEELINFLNNNLNSNIIFATIIQRNYNNTSMKGSFSDFNAVRLVRTDTNPRYEGSIHESFFISDINKVHILKNTIFDHDGYTSITSDHLKKKEERNLKLLEEKLKNEPDNIRCILLCLESSSLEPEKKRYYAEYAFKVLRKNTTNELFFKEIFGPACISTAIGYAIEEHHAFVEEHIKWAFDTFPNAPHILIDVNFYYAKFLHKREKHDLCVEIGTRYLEALNNFNDSSDSPLTTLLSTPVKCVQNKHKSEILTYIINSLIKLNKSNEAKELLHQLDLSEATSDTFKCFFNTIASPYYTKEICVAAEKVVTSFFKMYHQKQSFSNESYNSAISTLMNIFSCTKDPNLNYSNFADFNCSIGLSAKIADAKTKEEVEILLKKLEYWEEFMPVALKNAISLNATLPKEFFLTSSSHLNNLIQDLIEDPGDIFHNLSENYFDITKHNEWYEVSFSFNLLFSILMRNTHKFTSQQKIIFAHCFYKVSDLYLNTCYNTEIISNENNILCLPTTHLFSYYFVKAMKEKNNNSLEYIKLLKIALKKLPQAKQIVELLIEEYKNVEEKKKQENLKQTTPELITLAEQLKTMLSAFPKNSPELLAIKQSPLYKQVAFLIED